MISITTRNEYISKINFLNNHGIKNFIDYDETIQILENKYKNLSSLKSYIIAIIHNLKTNYEISKNLSECYDTNSDNEQGNTHIIIKKYTDKLAELNKMNKLPKGNITIDDIIKVRDSIVFKTDNIRKYKNDLMTYLILSIFIEVPKIRLSIIYELIYCTNKNFDGAKNYIVMSDTLFVYYKNKIFNLSDLFIDFFKNYINVFRLEENDKLMNDITEKQFRYLIVQIFKKNNYDVTLHILNSI